MARSSYIYCVFLNGELTHAFTVKYEMESILPADGKNVQIFRLKDGKLEDKINITHEFYE